MAFVSTPFGHIEYRVDSRDPRRPQRRPVRPLRKAAK
jgi:hypothetical protein